MWFHGAVEPSAMSHNQLHCAPLSDQKWPHWSLSAAPWHHSTWSDTQSPSIYSQCMIPVKLNPATMTRRSFEQAWSFCTLCHFQCSHPNVPALIAFSPHHSLTHRPHKPTMINDFAILVWHWPDSHFSCVPSVLNSMNPEPWQQQLGDILTHRAKVTLVQKFD